MKRSLLLAVLMASLMSSLALAKTTSKEATKKSNPATVATKNGVLDLGQLEVEGEVRKPGVSWIDSQKKMKGLLPELFKMEMQRLERKMLAPISSDQMAKKLEGEQNVRQ